MMSYQFRRPRQNLVQAFAVLFALTLVGCSNRIVGEVRIPDSESTEFRPLWKDNYKPTGTIPPWPQGPTLRQQVVMEGFDHAWATALDPEPVPYHGPEWKDTFHGHHALAVAEIPNVKTVIRLREGLRGCFNLRSSGWISEGYPGIGMRLQRGDDIVDLVIERRHRLIFIYDRESLTYMWFPDNSDLKLLFDQLAKELPVDPDAD